MFQTKETNDDGFPSDFNFKTYNIKANTAHGSKQSGVDHNVNLKVAKSVDRRKKPLLNCVGQFASWFGEYDYGDDGSKNKVFTTGTGTVFQRLKGGLFLIISCAHNFCAYSPIKKESSHPKDVYFFPVGMGEPHNRMKVIHYKIHEAYDPVMQISPFDIAVALCFDKRGLVSTHYNDVNINDMVSWYEWKDGDDDRFDAWGYPSQSKGLLQGDNGEATKTDDGLLLYDISTYSGQSGSAVFQKRKGKKVTFNIIAIHVWGNEEKQEDNCAVFLDQKKLNWIQQTANTLEKDASIPSEPKAKEVLSPKKRKAKQWLKETVDLDDEIINKLFDYGYDNIGALQTLEENDLKEMEIKKGHRKQLLFYVQRIPKPKAIKVYKRPKDDSDEEKESKEPICSLKMLKTHGVLGKGTYGLVTLVSDPYTGKSYALKAVNKYKVIEEEKQKQIISGKLVMEQLSNMFLVKLHKTYKDSFRVYFLYDACLGGNLFTILRAKRFFDEPTAKFYAASVCEAFAYMHSLDIIYRYLKPESLALDSKGYLKITDFDIAKKITDKTYTLCGTPDYLSPEIIIGGGYGKGSDWWALGILIYEMLGSFPPFIDDEPVETYRKILRGRVKMPRYFSAEVRDLIRGLLRTKATKRLGVLKGGAGNIRNHGWYYGFDFQKLRNGTMRAPIINKVKSNTDLSNYPQVDVDDEDDQPIDPKNEFDSEF